MSLQTASAVTPARTELRRDGWTLVAPLPAWLATFVVLMFALGPGGPQQPPTTAAEAAAQYDGSPAAGVIVFLLAGLVAGALMSWAALGPCRTLRNLPGGGPLRWFATAVFACSMLSFVLGTYVQVGLVVAEPPSYPPLVEELAVDGAWVGTVSYALICAVTGLVGWLLYRSRLLRRTGLTVAILAVPWTLLMLIGLDVPLLPALLQLVLGVGLLRRRA